MQRDSFIFYSSFYNALKLLQSDSDRLTLYDLICEYALKGKVSLKGISNAAKSIFTLIEPQLAANNKRYINAKKGGAPEGNKNAAKPPEYVSQEQQMPFALEQQKTTDNTLLVDFNSTKKQPKVELINNLETTDNQPKVELENNLKTTDSAFFSTKKQPNKNVNENENENVKDILSIRPSVKITKDNDRLTDECKYFLELISEKIQALSLDFKCSYGERFANICERIAYSSEDIVINRMTKKPSEVLSAFLDFFRLSGTDSERLIADTFSNIDFSSPKNLYSYSVVTLYNQAKQNVYR